MKTKAEIRAKIKDIRALRNYFQQFKNTEGAVFLCNGSIRGLQWSLDYKLKKQWWCHGCALLHNNLKCPICGNEIEHTEVDNA